MLEMAVCRIEFYA